ncbi:MAG: hypothetical protein Q8M93_07510 [Polaromonas sp.]|uniref:hypothetical protein n=1 Tax=Polaromonas sp. TaxID=1869339 RepID=UPI0027300BBA|nr:hypothetical protein [Polaromonas sp.]MDP2450394.1 hypothetical protein [Polaromonas sp.]MDP3246795.1 hypothetical protein [Polaromonas sp.]MDP3758017.1 hypothetical protein [Polaromonas sp.]MDP3828013.1 hypothetical protein [Polaromonas sp.]
MQQQVLESGTSQLFLRGYEAAAPVRASVVIDDELMTWRGTQDLSNLNSGFFCGQFSHNMWPHALQILEHQGLARPAAGVPGTTA